MSRTLQHGAVTTFVTVARRKKKREAERMSKCEIDPNPAVQHCSIQPACTLSTFWHLLLPVFRPLFSAAFLVSCISPIYRVQPRVDSTTTWQILCVRYASLCFRYASDVRQIAVLQMCLLMPVACCRSRQPRLGSIKSRLTFRRRNLLISNHRTQYLTKPTSR